MKIIYDNDNYKLRKEIPDIYMSPVSQLSLKSQILSLFPHNPFFFLLFVCYIWLFVYVFSSLSEEEARKRPNTRE